MDVIKIIGLLNGGAALFKTVMGLVNDVKDTLSEEDAQKVEDALAVIQAENDKAFADTRERLTALKGN